MTGVGEIAGMSIPQEVWHRIAIFLSKDSVADLLSFALVSRAAAEGVSRVETDRQRRVVDMFGSRSFFIPPELVERTVLVHLVPPFGDSLFAIAEHPPGDDEEEVHQTMAAELRGEHAQGFDVVWIKNGETLCKPLRIPGLPPPGAVSNIRFSPDGRYVAMLVTMNSGRALRENDPLGRLTGLARSNRAQNAVDDDASPGSDDSDREDTTFVPSSECALVVIHMRQNELGDPFDIETKVFAHVFVPEYGFDMRWTERRETAAAGEEGAVELAFAGILHATSTAALYMAIWKQDFRQEKDSFQFVACLPDIARELIEDKRDAMRVCDNTRVTSRVEMSADMRTIFFDTSAKFGVIRVTPVNPDSESAALEISGSLGIYHSSPRAVPFSRTPQHERSRRSMRARLSIQASLPTLASHLRGRTNSPDRDGVDSRRSQVPRSPSWSRRAKTFVQDWLPWKRWFSVSCDDFRTQQAKRSTSSSPSPDAIASSPEHIKTNPQAGIASAMRRFLRKPGGIGTRNPTAESSFSSIPWHTRGNDSEEHVEEGEEGEDGEEDEEYEEDEEDKEDEEEDEDESESEGDLVPMNTECPDSAHSFGEWCSKCQDCGCVKPCIVHDRSGASPRALHFESDSGGAQSSASPSLSVRSQPSGLQSPWPDEHQTHAPPALRDPSFSTTSRAGERHPSTPRVAIKSPPRVSRPELPQMPSRARRIAISKTSFISQSPRVTCMSPDGTKLASVYVMRLAAEEGEPAAHMTCVEVRSTADGSVIFRNCRTARTNFPADERGAGVRFEKTFEVVAQTCGFSADSSLLWVRDAYISAHQCASNMRLPTVFRARDGAVVRGFSEGAMRYKHLQMAGDGLSVYATRFVRGGGAGADAGAGERGVVVVDAIDAVSGAALATATVAGPMLCPDAFNPQAVYLVGESDVRGISRGGVDALWECTRGGVGCHWCPNRDVPAAM